jgi:hypothetical protein
VKPYPVARLVRGWVDLYTRGMPPAVRAARRDEINDDLWCQHEEAETLGRSPRSLAGEILLRLILGIPSDLTWRMSRHGRSAPVPTERSTSMGARIVGALAMIGGISWGILAAVTIFNPATPWTGAPSSADLVPMVIGALGLAGAITGLAFVYQDQIRLRAGLAAVLGGSWLAAGIVPIASAILVWELAHIGAVSRALAVAHGLSAALFIGLVISFIDDGTLANQLYVALGVPYALTWILIGASVVRGVHRALEPAPQG